MFNIPGGTQESIKILPFSIWKKGEFSGIMGVIDPPLEEAFPHGEGGSPEARRMRGALQR